jgi:tetratricopeptide (TPR) repeat protein
MKRILCFAMLLIAASQSLFAATPAETFDAGRAAVARRDFQAAVDLFEKAVAAKPGDSSYHYWLGSAYGNLAASSSMFKAPGYAKKAKAALEKSVALDPNNLEARVALLEYFLLAPGIMGGSEEKAQEQAAEIKRRDAVEGYRAQGRIYQHQKKDALAKKEYVDAVRAHPTSAKAHYNLGIYLLTAKDQAGALHEMEYTLKMDPSHMMALFRIGQLAAMTNSNHARGEEALKKYATHTPKSDEATHSRTWYWLGVLYEKSGRKAEAKTAFQQSLRLAPGVKEVTEALKRVS